MPNYRLKTVKINKQEFSCIEAWSEYNRQIKQIAIIGKSFRDTYITYDYSPMEELFNNNITYFDIKTNKGLEEEPFNYIKVYTFLKNNNIPDKIIKKFMNKISILQNRG